MSSSFSAFGSRKISLAMIFCVRIGSALASSSSPASGATAGPSTPALGFSAATDALLASAVGALAVLDFRDEAGAAGLLADGCWAQTAAAGTSEMLRHQVIPCHTRSSRDFLRGKSTLSMSRNL